MIPDFAVGPTHQDDPGIPGFWSAIRAASSVSLLLDYDGTLAPFHIDRMKAVPAPGAVDALQQIRQQTDTIVVLVSGRPVQEILQLMPHPEVTIIGTHGFEVRHPGGDVATAVIEADQADLLDRAYSDARRLVGAARTERKVATVAAHFRGLDRIDARQLQSDILRRWLSYSDKRIVEVRQFNGGLEMRALGKHKGTAVADFLDQQAGPVLPVFIGDDDTDEDAFRAVKQRDGYAIRVGSLEHGTEATGSLASCDAVVAFLNTWIGARAHSEDS
jgi:trehalose 6-phosphate phosphatase